MTFFDKAPEGPVSTVMFNKMVNDSALVAVLGGITPPPIFDIEAPVDQTMPYMNIGDISSTPYTTHSSGGHTLLVPLHSWDKTRSWSLLDSIGDRLLVLFGNKYLDIPGFRPFPIEFGNSSRTMGTGQENRHLLHVYKVTVLNA